MQSPWNGLLQQEIANDRLRTVGYLSRVERRRRDRSRNVRRAAGALLVAAGERLVGTNAVPARRA